ncbi:amino acid adenylation domain-containing protein [Streptomyces sp. NPDC052644]
MNPSGTDDTAQNVDEIYVMPASPAQLGLWLLVQLDPRSTAYHVPAAVRLTGRLDTSALENALHRLWLRHEILRTTFALEDGGIQQVIRPPRPELHPEYLDLREAGAGAEAACRAELARRAAVPFDLERGPLLRVTVCRLADEDHVLSLLMHHIVTDGWSLGVFVRELAVLYRAALTGEEDPLPPVRLQYADFALWHRERLDSGVREQQLSHWRVLLDDPDLTLQLPTDRPRPRTPGHAGDRVTTVLGPQAAARTRTAAARLGATAFMAVHAAFAAVLARNSAQTRVRLGVPAAGRGHDGTADLLGFLANTLVVTTDLDRSLGFGDLLTQVRERTTEALTHGDVPFGEIVRALGAGRDRSRHPLFQAMVSMDNAPDEFDLAPGLVARRFDVPHGTAKFDLTLFLRESPAGLELALEYATDLFTRATAEGLLEQTVALLESGTRTPDRPLGRLVDVPEERRRQLERWSRGPRPDPADLVATAPERFAREAIAHPDAVALVDGDRTVSYGELDALSGRIAAALTGTRPGDVIGVAVPRSVEMVAALLAVWKRGAAYLPLDPAQPAARLAAIVDDARPRAILATDGHGTSLTDVVPVHDVRALLDAPHAAPAEGTVPLPGDLAYVLYTSGSTGRPKGVRISHAGLANYLAWATAEYCPHRAPLSPLHTTIGFDLTVTSLWLPLTAGGAVHLVDADSPLDALARMLTGPNCPDLVKLTPSHLRALCGLLSEGALAGRSVCFVVGGETLPPDLVRRLFAVAPDARVVNEYGPTETVVGCCTATFSAADDPGERPGVPIGTPIAGTRLHVVDEDLELVPPGTPGELLIGGSGVALGYTGDGARTAAAFVPDPFSGEPGARLYRTGDIVRHLPDGRLEFLGRRDHQLKIRGQRIEPAEVEAALRTLPEVTDAVVIAVPDRHGEPRLAAWVTAPTADATGHVIRTSAARVLPDAMVPSAVTVLRELPLTPNGKVDRSALPSPHFTDRAAHIPPETPTERLLAELYGEVLGVTRVGRDDDFLALGGHSLLGVQLVARVRERLGVELPLRTLFRHPRLRDLAAALHDAPATGDTAPILTVRSGPAELSYAQQRLWLLHRLQPDSPAYNIPAAVRLTGPLDEERLRHALYTVAGRHDILRTTFTEQDGRPVQIVGERPLVEFTRTDLRDDPDPRAAASRIAAELAARPFDLGREALARWTLARTGEQEYVLALCLHHIITDGWSTGVLLREVRAHYSGEELPELPLQYADYAAWQRQWLDSGVLRRQLDHWRDVLAGAPPALELPTDLPRPAIPSLRGVHLHDALAPDTVAALRGLAEDHGATLFMVLQAVWSALLARRSGQNDIVVGVPVAGRSRTETENLIGFFVNTLPLRTRVDHREPFGRLLDRVRANCLDAFAHQDVPFERLVEELAPERDLSRNPIFQAMLILQNAPRDERTTLGAEGEVTLERLPLEEGMAKFDITLMAEEPTADGPLPLVLEYATDLFTEETARAVLADFVRACETLVRRGPAAPTGELTTAPPEERARLLGQWNTATRPADTPGVTERVRHHATTTPDTVAVQDSRTALSYRELAARADHVSTRLAAAGVRPGDRVALLLDRGAEAVTAVLGVLGAGATFVPLDTSAPAARSAAVLADCGAHALLSSPERAALARELAAGATVLELDGGATPDGRLRDLRGQPGDAACLLYTSGSTGRPRGVVIDRAGLDNQLLAKAEDTGLTADDVVAQNSPLSFVVSVWQILTALTAGGCVLVVDDTIAQDATGLFEHAAASCVTVLEVVPSLLRAALDAWDTLGAAPSLPTLRRLVVTGEALPSDLCRRWLARHPGIPLMNAYGSTECSDDVAHALIADPAATGPVRAPVGRPVRNTRLYVVDEWLEPVPAGVPGELLVGGTGVGWGYVGDTARTASVFVPDPFSGQPGARLYRTGDIVRHLPDGRLEVLGRRDHQVKVRGRRIEPGEVEAALRAVAGVRDAVVLAVPDGQGETRLAGYVTGSVTAHDVRAAAARLLPDAMVPSAVTVLESMPLNRNGKIDRKALPAPRFADHASYEPPRTVHEYMMATLFAEVLGVARAGRADSFFALGGHSLLATRLVARVREQFGVDLPLRTVFSGPRLSELAEAVARAEAEGNRGAGADAELERLLAEIEGLTDEDVAARLSGGGPTEPKGP